MANRQVRVMQAQLKKAMVEDHPNILFDVDESDMKKWHVLVVGLPYPYTNGEFLFSLEMPEGFPLKPPSLRCLTPNGVFELGPRICISIGEYHSRDHRTTSAAAGADWGWRPALGAIGFAREVVNGLVVPSSLNGSKHPDTGMGGIGVLNAPVAERAKLTATSRQHNLRKNCDAYKRFEKLRETATDAPPKALVAWRVQVARSRLQAAASAAAEAAARRDDLDADSASLEIGTQTFEDLVKVYKSCPEVLELHDRELARKLVAATRGERVSLENCGIANDKIANLGLGALAKLVVAIDRSDFGARDSILDPPR